MRFKNGSYRTNHTLIAFALCVLLNIFWGRLLYAQTASRTSGAVSTNPPIVNKNTSKKKEIVITTFGPFLGRQVNITDQVADLIKAKLEDTDNFNIHICTLSTTYDISSEEAIRCIEKLKVKPDFVISLGEGPSCDDIIFETMARNRDNAKDADSMKKIRLNSIIKNGGPDRVGFSEAVSDMYCALPKTSRQAAIISNDAGGFVCNNLSYLMALYLHPKKIPYTFIHVPPSECSKYGYHESTLASSSAFDLSLAILSIFPAPVRKQQGKDYCKTLPTNLNDLSLIKDRLIEEVDDSDVKSCKKSFYEKFKTTFEQENERGTK